MDVHDLRQRAESGNCSAQCVLGICYLDGVDVEVNYQEAFRLLSNAANQGASRALVNLARMHAEGLGIVQNVPEAIRLYKTVAEIEFLAPIGLGRIYARGVGLPVDRNEALKWYTAAAEWEDRIGDCEEIQEAKAYVAGKP